MKRAEAQVGTEELRGTRAIDGIRADRAALLEIGAGLSSGQWQADSGCPGWSVPEVISDIGALFWLVVDPSVLPGLTGLGTVRASGDEAQLSIARSLRVF